MIDADCDCHLLIEDCSVETQYGTAVKCVFQVLAASDASQKGKQVSEFFPCEGKAVDKLYNLAEAAGIITAEQRKAAADAGLGLDIDESLFKGRQICASVKMEPNMTKNEATGKYEPDKEKPGPYPRIGFRTFSVHSPKAIRIPKDKQFLGMLTQQAGGPATQQQPPAAAAPAAGNAGMDW